MKINNSASSGYSQWQLYYQHALGLKVWPTKCYEFWLILQQLLCLVKPQTIVELGAGRSTNYIAEYVHKFGGVFVSFEQHLYYYLKLNLAFKLSFLPRGLVRYAPLKGDWYEEQSIRKNLRAIKAIDFLFLDGPTTASRGQRDSKMFWEIMTPLLKDVKMIIVDDVHRPQEDALARRLEEMFHLKRYEMSSICDHTRIAILVAPDAAEKIKLLPDFLQKCLDVR